MSKTVFFKPIGDRALDPRPVCLKVPEGMRDRLLSTEGWQQKTREFWDELIEKYESKGKMQ